MPLVSVVVPAYNAEKYLEETLAAIVNQTYQHWELIIVNNASTDGTQAIIERIARQDPRIKVITNRTTLPAPENWNIGLQKATGDLLKMVCADDVPLADCIERQVQALTKHREASLASGSRIIINGAGKRLFVRNGIGKSGVYDGGIIKRRCVMAGGNIIGDPVCAMWRRAALDSMGYFNPEIVYCTDMEYWLRLLSIGDLYYDERPMGLYRIHKNAAAKGLSKVAAADIYRTAAFEVQRGSMKLSQIELGKVWITALVMSRVRQLIYNVLG